MSQPTPENKRGHSCGCFLQRRAAALTAAAARKREEKRGYMVCTGNYVTTNTRKQKRAARSSAETGCHPKEAHPEKASVCET
jgi:hypothetical protein